MEEARWRIGMTQQIAIAAGIIGFLICIATALILALCSSSKEHDA
jgi:hypothetical protein